MTHNLTIIIPFYREVEHLRSCLRSLESQTDKSFDVIIVNDCSPVDCDSVVSSTQLKVKLLKNSERKGALNNMLYCAGMNVDTPYTMVFHQDDLLHPQFVEIFNENVKSWGDFRFVISKMDFFSDEATFQFSRINSSEDSFIPIDRIKLIEAFVKGEPLCFGSVVYNKYYVDTDKFDFNQFNTVADRPFLVENLDDAKALVSTMSFVGYRNHEGIDNRAPNLKEEHIFNLYSYYHRHIEKSEFHDDFHRLVSNQIFEAYWGLRDENKSDFDTYLNRAKELGLFKYHHLKFSSWKKLLKFKLLTK